MSIISRMFLKPVNELIATQNNADANRFTAHKVVLAATIPFFNGMFLSNMAESTKSEVAIHGLDACALEAFIGYAYTGLVQINPRNVQSILIGANFLQLNNVRNICCRYISERLTVDIVLPLRSLAQSFLCTDLVSACEIYIFRNFEKIAHTSSFFNLEISELLELLESDELNVSSEEQLFHIVMSWVEYDTKLSSHTGANSDSSGSLTGPSENCVFNENSIKSDNYNGTDYPTPCRNSSLHSVHYSHSPYSVKSSDNKPRTDFLPCLLRRIRLPLIPVSFIFSVISRHELIRQDIRCRDILDEVRDTLLMSWKTTEFFNCRPRRCQDVFGVIYAVGGWNADLECHGIVETYHPSLGRWELSESMISRRSRIGVVALNGLLYAIGGFDGTSRLRTTEVYNPKVGKWMTVAPMICRRSAAGAAAYDGCLYVCGGFDGQTSLRTCEMYIPEQNTWKLISSLNEPRSAGGLVALGGRLYAIGGHNGLAVFSTVECYEKSGDIPRALSPSSYCETNPRVRQNSTNVWYSVANMLHRRCRHGATAFRDRIIVAGGYNGASFLQSVEMFDPTTGPDRNGLYGQWTEILSLSVPRSRVGLAVTAGCLYAIGE
ncbi:Kelch-like protein isoform 1 [Schistosoma japonicum]|uniref:Kelch-like protein isoform 1 n=1 Tax=Schistosoma japonicum TaxID=6182 RepID=A0A4Z2D0P9_SCHJA|nr:Kelch-like protein isoform 1 [Schistosoma japonicum]